MVNEVTMYGEYVVYNTASARFLDIEHGEEFNMMWVEDITEAIRISERHIDCLTNVLRILLKGDILLGNEDSRDVEFGKHICRLLSIGVINKITDIQLVPMIYRTDEEGKVNLVNENRVGANFLLAEPLLNCEDQRVKVCPECGGRIVSTPLGTGCTKCNWRNE